MELQNVVLIVHIDAQTHSTRSHACSFVKNVVPNAYVCLVVPMETKKYVHAITTGRPKEEDPNVLKS
jgi:hypothetical protein